MSCHDPFPRPVPRHQPRLSNLQPSAHDLPLVHSWLHSAYHDLQLVEYHPGTHRLPPFHDGFFAGRDWTQWDRFSLRCFASQDERDMYGLVYFSEQCEGPPRVVHGGCVATVLDEAHVSAMSYNAQTPPWTKRLTINYRRPIPLGSTLQFRCWHTDDKDGTSPGTCELLSLTRADGTVAVAETSEDFTLYATSEAIAVIKGGREQFQHVLGPKFQKLTEAIPAKL